MLIWVQALIPWVIALGFVALIVQMYRSDR